MRELEQVGVEVVAHWHQDGKDGVTLGTRRPDSLLIDYQYPVNTTRFADPELSAEEVRAIRRTFGIGET